MLNYLSFFYKQAWLVAIYCLITGCASTLSHGHYYTVGAEQDSHPFYSGTALDLSLITHGVRCTWYDNCAEGDTYAVSLAPFSVLDLPFSAVLDTLLLPIDAVIYYRQTDQTLSTSKQGNP